MEQVAAEGVNGEAPLDVPEINDTTFKKLVEEEIQRIKAKTIYKEDALGYKGIDMVEITRAFQQRTYNFYNHLYFDDDLPSVQLSVRDSMDGNLGQFDPMDCSISILLGEWKYQNNRNALVHDMCHLLVHITAGEAGAGAGDGHGKDWLEIVERLNKEHPELNITMLADERPK